MEGALLEDHYRKTLIELGKSGGMLGIIFRKAQNKNSGSSPWAGFYI